MRLERAFTGSATRAGWSGICNEERAQEQAQLEHELTEAKRNHRVSYACTPRRVVQPLAGTGKKPSKYRKTPNDRSQRWMVRWFACTPRTGIHEHQQGREDDAEADTQLEMSALVSRNGLHATTCELTTKELIGSGSYRRRSRCCRASQSSTRRVLDGITHQHLHQYMDLQTHITQNTKSTKR